MTCRKKYKIQKNVREHNRKQRKEDKLNANKKRKPKDLGIPNLYPFKEQLLKSIQEKKEKDEDDKVKAKEQKQKNASRKRKLVDLQKDADKRAKLFDKMQDMEVSEKLSEHNTGPVEDSKKCYFRELKKVVEAADVIIQVLDARDPLGCRCPQLEELVMSSGQNKKLVLLLNKIDLIPKGMVEKWLKYLRNEYPAVAFKASTQTQKQKLSQSKVSVTFASEDLLKSSNCIGAGVLLKLLGNYCRKSNIKSAITVGIVGFPNVGKSSVINSLKRSKACNVGATPGVTKCMQEIQLDQHVKLLDCPGVVMSMGTSDTQIILSNAVKVESLVDPVKPVEAILSRCNKRQVIEKYCVADYGDTVEFLSMFARRLGKLKKGGVPDVLAAAKMVLQDWNTGKITFYTHPPKRPETEHDSATVMQYLGAEFDFKVLEDEENGDLNGLMEAMTTALVLEPGKPTDMEDVVEEEEEEEEENSDIEDDVEEEDKMADSDDDAENAKDSCVIEMIVKKKTTKELSDKESKGVKLTEDVTNMQANRVKKKAFKSQQKDEKKKMNKLVAAEMVALDAKEAEARNAVTAMSAIDEDAYNFEEMVTQ